MIARLILAPPGAKANLTILDTEQRMPWSGHSARHALAEVYAAVRAAGMTLIFVNTRSQAEFIFQALWSLNEDNLPIALHHGSLDASQRRRVEEAMAAGRLKAVVCTSTLGPRHRLGRRRPCHQHRRAEGRVAAHPAHRPRQPSPRRTKPRAARAVEPVRGAGVPRRARRRRHRRAGHGGGARGRARRAVPAHPRHGLRRGRSTPDALHAEITSAEPYRDVSRETFERALAFVAHGGYALAGYERFAKIKQAADGRWRIANGRIAQSYRNERRHDRRGVLAQGAAGQGEGGGQRHGGLHRPAAARRPRARRAGGRLPRKPGAGRHLPLRRRDPGASGHRRERGAGVALALRHAARAHLCRRASFRCRPTSPRACATCWPTPTIGARCRCRSRNGWSCSARRSALPPPGDLLVETFPARRALLPRLLPVRGPPRPPDARHAADAAHGAAVPQAAWFRRQRLRDGGVAEDRRRPARPARGSSRSTSCSPATCSATISRNGCRNRR